MLLNGGRLHSRAVLTHDLQQGQSVPVWYNYSYVVVFSYKCLIEVMALYARCFKGFTSSVLIEPKRGIGGWKTGLLIDWQDNSISNVIVLQCKV